MHQSFGCHIALDEEIAFCFLSPYLNTIFSDLLGPFCREENLETAGGWVGDGGEVLHMLPVWMSKCTRMFYK